MNSTELTWGGIDGRRKCTIRSCTEVIPPTDVYRWKMCEGCRSRTRHRARDRKYAAPIRSDCEDDDEENEDVPLEIKRQIQNLKGLKLTFQGRTIASVDTRPQESPVPLTTSLATPVTPLKTLRRLSMVSRHYGAIEDGSLTATQFIDDNVPRVALYQSNETLLDDLYDRLTNYLEAHNVYLSAKLSSANAPSVFQFTGEFSVVANPTGGDVGAQIETLQRTIGQRLGVNLSYAAQRLTCALSLALLNRDAQAYRAACGTRWQSHRRVCVRS
ncbi:hypothetical protein BC835DRAFT_863351 [Cytidiella melzeri]|nr:hypothetical protein BC835DRAFT_863351 [Cytidiella melzeri]